MVLKFRALGVSLHGGNSENSSCLWPHFHCLKSGDFRGTPAFLCAHLLKPARKGLFWRDISSLETNGDIGVCLCSSSMVLFTCQSQPAARDSVPSTQGPVMGSIKMYRVLGSQVTRARFALRSRHSSFFPAPQPLLSWDSGVKKWPSFADGLDHHFITY